MIVNLQIETIIEINLRSIIRYIKSNVIKNPYLILVYYKLCLAKKHTYSDILPLRPIPVWQGVTCAVEPIFIWPWSVFSLYRSQNISSYKKYELELNSYIVQ